MRRRGQRRSVRRYLGVGATVTVLTIAGISCSSDGNVGPSPSTPTTTAPIVAPRVDDGVLTLGALIPISDSQVGALLTANVKEAVRAVNDAGGVLGNDVELLIEDEGSTPVSAAQGIQLLIADGVDAIIGPTSSVTAIGALDEAISAGVVTCSATATAIALDGLPDDGLFFRTIATDSLQAIAIADEAEATGARNVAIVYVDDAYGRPYAEAVAAAIDGPIEIDKISVRVDDDDLTNELDALVGTGAEVAVILGNGEDTARFLEAMGQRSDIDLASVIVNDAARSAASRPVIAALPSPLRNRIIGIAPQIRLPDVESGVANPAFGPQVTDCVNLLSLSAIQADSDAPSDIAAEMPSVSDGGAPCRSFEECVMRLENGQEIDYDGPTTITALGRNGDPSRAFFDRFRFADDGSDVYERSRAVS